MVINTAQEDSTGPTPAYIASFSAAMPTTTEGTNAALVVTGTPDNCLLDTRSGMHPTVPDPGIALQAARSGIILNVNHESPGEQPADGAVQRRLHRERSDRRL